MDFASDFATSSATGFFSVFGSGAATTSAPTAPGMPKLSRTTLGLGLGFCSSFGLLPLPPTIALPPGVDPFGPFGFGVDPFGPDGFGPDGFGPEGFAADGRGPFGFGPEGFGPAGFGRRG